ncbi:DUF488 family protein [Cellulomonas fimi]|uniref:DUF488 domain-containing protein n=1 Tax=Cellulomonas fimi TaxID=1708 RepID=A0A7Y0LXA9_CELFI|nr:DUF488 domain-containing protein [Cellulomonas fimi]NMR19977.1 DUF488 domain-containing protein [Cellulomonas fimi]
MVREESDGERAGDVADVTGPPGVGPILTIGHSTRPIEELVGLLRDNEVTQLIDIRTVPRSRHNPQFGTDVLVQTVPALSGGAVGYRHVAALGGLRKATGEPTNAGWRNASFRGYADYMQTEAFAAAVEALEALAASERPAIMCAEAVPWRCHRSLVADALLVRGVDVRHIMGPGTTSPATLTRFARVEGTRVTYPSDDAAEG